MRLVSACYADFHPFDVLPVFTEYISSIDPQDLKQGDVLLVWGGEDIHPSLYAHGRSFFSGADEQPGRRDIIEWSMMHRAKELNIPIIGVCRGAQMLCALAGGHLIQHVSNHGGFHAVHTHDGQTFMTNSMHHQMMVPDGTDHTLLCWTKPRSNTYWICPQNEDMSLYKDKSYDVDPEYVYFNSVKGYAVQWHPEFAPYPDAGTEYLLKHIEDTLHA